MPKGTPIRCSTCKFWNADNPRLDGGRNLLGLCTGIGSYEEFSRNVRYRTGHATDAHFAGMQEELKKNSRPLLQKQFLDDGDVFFRTPADFHCGVYAGKEAPVPAESAKS